MRKAILFVALVVLATALPAYCQTDLSGDKLPTEVRITLDGSNYSDGRTSQTGTVDIKHRLADDFAIEAVVNGGQYFGSAYGGGGLGFTYNPTSSSYIMVNGLRNSVTGTTQVYQGTIEGGTLLWKGENFLKAVEGDGTLTVKGYNIQPDTKVILYSPRVIFYFPRGFDLMIHAGAVDTLIAGHHNTTPSGGARIRVPVVRRVELTGSVGFDSEGMTNVLQILSLSTRNYGGGAKLWINRTTSIEVLGTQSLYTINHLVGTTYAATLVKRF